MNERDSAQREWTDHIYITINENTKQGGGGGVSMRRVCRAHLKLWHCCVLLAEQCTCNDVMMSFHTQTDTHLLMCRGLVPTQDSQLMQMPQAAVMLENKKRPEC